MPDLSLKDKVAIVTGGSGDIGGAIARKLAEQGATTIATYVGNEKGAMELVQSIQEKGGIARAVQMDQRSPCLLYTSPSPRDLSTSRMPSSA